ncbi:MAG: hypothetical protein PHQ60_13630 [Sideroxydans sp.]|nr:hypothetical protein [Sideroxydans sp.]
MPIGSQWIKLDERAKALESRAAARKREAWAEVLARFPGLSQKYFGNLSAARQRGKLSIEAAQLVEEFEREISSIINEAKLCHEESKRFLEEVRKADTRRKLDPSVDTIPPGIYPKFRECAIYPLRYDCNRGENEMSRWDRCSHMKYDNNKSIYDSNRWKCTAPK